MANHQYPADPFKKVDALLGDLIDSFQHADDCNVVAEIRDTVANTMQLAAQREAKVQESVKGLSSRVTELESSGRYSPAKSSHEKRIAQLEQQIQKTMDRMQRLRDDIRGSSDQQQEVEAAQDELKKLKEALDIARKEEEPRVKYQNSLYAHITEMAFEPKSLDQQVKQATVCNKERGDIIPLSMDFQTEPAFDIVNRVWDAIGG